MANPQETGLYPYNVTVNGTAITLGREFQRATQTVQSPNASPVIYGGEIITIVGENNTNEYIGTATNSTGATVGFIVLDETTSKYYLMATAPLTGDAALTLHLSSGINDSRADNWDLATTSPQAYCFMAGTSIRTPAGGVPVETLRAGDAVTLADGRSAEISWLGRQSVSMAFADPLRVLPVRIKAGAVGEGLPARDLLISPDHAILLDGILVQAGALVNGGSIVRETKVPVRFTYYHVEVVDHSLILAEGLPAETFIDNVDRLKFDNWEEHQLLHGDAGMIREMDYPRAKSARQLTSAIRDRLRARAGVLLAGACAAA